MDDYFQLTITQVHHVPKGSGMKRHLKPGHRSRKFLKVKKKSIVQIRNEDDLCCARTLVTAKAKVDHHPRWESFKKGRELQKKLHLTYTPKWVSYLQVHVGTKS